MTGFLKRVGLKGLFIVVILFGIFLWLYNADINKPFGVEGTSVIEKSKKKKNLLKVIVRDVSPQVKFNKLSLISRARANQVVHVMSQITSKIVDVKVKPGQFVKKNDVLCQLDDFSLLERLKYARQVRLKAKTEYDAALALKNRGRVTSVQLEKIKTSFAQANLNLNKAKLDFENTKIKASISGSIQSSLPSLGDLMTPGELCAVIVNDEKMIFSGWVSELGLAKINVPSKVDIYLVDGSVKVGTLFYVSKLANHETKSYKVEIEVDNKDHMLRDGLIADVKVPLAKSNQYYIDAYAILLDMSGNPYLMVVDDKGVTKSQLINIQEYDKGGVWFTGPKGKIKVIVVGQNKAYIGQKVNAIYSKS